MALDFKDYGRLVYDSDSSEESVCVALRQFHGNEKHVERLLQDEQFAADFMAHQNSIRIMLHLFLSPKPVNRLILEGRSGERKPFDDHFAAAYALESKHGEKVSDGVHIINKKLTDVLNPEDIRK
jgi:hypothetical protein